VVPKKSVVASWVSPMHSRYTILVNNTLDTLTQPYNSSSVSLALFPDVQK
jgi:hypothetical protein